ncbi:MAG: hypothetical protein M3011_04820 [Actinomycetota bacterium]|nr:hypothetical protein [Actinomycetota bacterium]
MHRLQEISRSIGIAGLAAALTTVSGAGASGLAQPPGPGRAGGTSASRAARPRIRRVEVTGTVAHPTITIFGSNFGSRPRHDPATSPDGQQGCPASTLAGAGYLFGTNLFVEDLKASAGGFAGQQWDAGVFTPGGEGEFDCVGLLIKSWTSHVITLHYGNLYDRDIPGNNYVLSNGDPLRVGVRGVTFDTIVQGLRNGPPGGGSTTTTVPSSTSTTSVPSSTTTSTTRPPSTTTSTTVPSSTSTTRPSTTTTTTAPSGTPTITSVTTSGTVARPTITVLGSGFGAQPAPDPAAGPSGQQGCPVTTASGSGHLFGESLILHDSAAQSGGQSSWTAGENNGGGSFDCIGLVIQSWSATQVTFTFGDLYDQPGIVDNFYVLTNGDPIVVQVKGATSNATVQGLS